MVNLHPHWHKGAARVPVSRSLVKTIGYRAISMAQTALVAWLVFGSWELAGGFAILDAEIGRAHV